MKSGRDAASSTSRPAQRADGLDIETLYRKYAGTVLRRARRFFDEHEAEEVTHEVFMRAMASIDNFKQASSPTTWLYRLTTNYCLNRIRDQRRRRELLDENYPFLRAGQVQAPQQDISLFMSELWKNLDEDLAQIGVHYYVDGLTHDEIARIVGCAPRTVGFRLDKLKQQARAFVAGPDDEGGPDS